MRWVINFAGGIRYVMQIDVHRDVHTIRDADVYTIRDADAQIVYTIRDADVQTVHTPCDADVDIWSKRSMMKHI